ncbi:hypothetical protein H5410_060584 [Solanum commersonii]|uniref:Protein TIC 214 n=1 Tax=Solanum commersonii TaxID=4109 RepID=A0A9J5W5M1_SOLCO|nr:hypothetical protein H5410_060584 [Solanum commersonii]
MEKPIQADSIDVDSEEESEVQWTTMKMSKKKIEEVFTLLEKSSYNFSNLARLGDLKHEITDENEEARELCCHSYVWIRIRLDRDSWNIMTSSYHTSLQKKKKVDDKETQQQTPVFECVGRLTPYIEGGVFMMFISIYYVPMHLALGRPRAIIFLALPYLLFHFFWNNNKKNYYGSTTRKFNG